jgi:hypothetical protein
MRPEDIKVGTVFKDNENRLQIVSKISNGKEVCSVYLEGEEMGRRGYFSLDSEYAEECELVFESPNQPENPKQQEVNLILPPYYATDTPYEPFKIADFYNMNIREFSALKYLLRSKDQSKRVEDLKKAITCIHKEIIRLESLKESGN